MKNWIYYKDQAPVNMGSMSVVGKPNDFSIAFYGNDDASIVRWIFDSEVECDLVYKTIKDQMTEIKLDYHPDLDED